jgi:hypothetical protein
MRWHTAAMTILALVCGAAPASPTTAAAGNVLVIPAANGSNSTGLVLLAQVSERLREAELNRLSCSASPGAELQYQDALQALIDGRYRSGILHLKAARKVLSIAPDPSELP